MAAALHAHAHALTALPAPMTTTCTGSTSRMARRSTSNSLRLQAAAMHALPSKTAAAAAAMQVCVIHARSWHRRQPSLLPPWALRWWGRPQTLVLLATLTRLAACTNPWTWNMLLSAAAKSATHTPAAWASACVQVSVICAAMLVTARAKGMDSVRGFGKFGKPGQGFDSCALGS